MKRLTHSTHALTLALAVLVTFSFSSCESQRRPASGGWHNMGFSPKENHQMLDSNMPSHR